MARGDQDLDAGVSLPDPLRRILGSAVKLQLLCEIEAGVADTDALASLVAGAQRNSLNLHLNELEEAGWIRVRELEKRRGSYARLWELADSAFSWRELVAQLRRDVVPIAVPPRNTKNVGVDQ